MVLVRPHLSLIQNGIIDKTCRGSFQLNVTARIALLAASLYFLAKAICFIALACLGSIAYLLTFCSKECKSFLVHKIQNIGVNFNLSAKFLISSFSPKFFAKQMLKSPEGAYIRENRIRFGATLIQKKLAKELKKADEQMRLQIDGAFANQNVPNPENRLLQVGRYPVGICQTVGRRWFMEDEELADLTRVIQFDKGHPVCTDIPIFGIFDGHGGQSAAIFVMTHLKEALKKNLEKFNRNGFTDEGIWNALKMTFVYLNQHYKQDAGSTATVSIILNGKLWTANVGDTRAILVRNGVTTQLTEDAKPGDKRYQKGILDRGGSIIEREDTWRVNGVLAVARSIGDHILKGAVSARPKITAIPVEDIPPGSFLCIGCDGLFDVASSRQVGDCIWRNREAQGGNPANPNDLAGILVDNAYRGFSMDNISAMVVRL